MGTTSFSIGEKGRERERGLVLVKREESGERRSKEEVEIEGVEWREDEKEESCVCGVGRG